MRFPPANLQLRRAQLVLMLAVLLPTVAMTGVGIVLLVLGGRTATTLISGALVLTFCTSGITGYILGSIFVGKGASLVRVQNDFVSSVSHELRTPITSIRLFMESLRDNRLDDADRQQVVTLLARETERLEELVNKVLELSRLQSSHHYKRERIAVSDLVEDSIHAFDALTLTRPTPIARTIEDGLQVVGDRATLVRALVNLMTNAWKYTGEDKQISVEARTAGRWIELIVRDNGVGIDRSERRAIFEQFNRGRAAHEGGAQGVGLGLSFVSAIVRGHRGKIDVESVPGATAFRIRLRRRREPRPELSSASLKSLQREQAS
ncbi:MAG: two-component sensor histidine kinase [Deltaproteobacteria bacterium]|nr:two-component sensor histidine kinase [Deltaproteobacteria bacterium]MCW5801485.1 two-component sensor histidine kinase [Deltaproteobacteria bacterium]